MVNYIVAIPARLGSTRLPNKAILDVEGIPLIRRVCMQALKSNASNVIACIDDDKIAAKLENLDGVTICMTDSNAKSGTDRIAMMLSKLNIDDDTIVVNVQGDEPLINIEHIEQVASLLDDKNADMATLCSLIKNEDDVFNPNCVKVVMDKNNMALYFSRAPIPYERDNFANNMRTITAKHYHHIGIYAYRAKMVKEFSKMPQTSLEISESLEQLRLLENGYKIALGITDTPPEIGVDTLDDLKRVCSIIRAKEKIK